MESAPEPRPFRPFTEGEREIIDKFCSASLPELQKVPSSLDIGDVLERLTAFVTNKIRLVTGFQGPFFLFPHPDEKVKSLAELHLPFSTTTNEVKRTIRTFRTDHRLGDHHVGLEDCLRMSRNDYLPLALHMFRERYGTVGNDVIEALFAILRENDPQIDTDSSQQIAEVGESDKQKLLIESIGSVLGSSIPSRILKRHPEWTFERAMDACVRVFLQSEDARRSFFILLRNQRLNNSAALAEAITRQAHSMFAEMEGMTKHDQWIFHRETKEIEAKRAQDSFRMAATMIAQTQGIELEGIDCVSSDEEEDVDGFLEDPFPAVQEYPELPEDILDPEDAEVYLQALKYLATHKPEQRTALLEHLDAKACRKKIEELRSIHSWHALGAFQRSVLARIYEETVRFPYGIPEADHDIVEDQSHRTSSPVFATEERRLNCLSGQWLMTVLAVECGIPYENIAFCAINLDGAGVSGVHGKMMFALEDGTLVLMDHAYKDCLLHLPLVAIENKAERRALTAFFEQRWADAMHGMKWIGDPVRIQVDPKISDMFHLPANFHLVCPDQAFSSRSLFNVGIAFEREGKKEEARHAYEIALVIEPTNADILTRLGALSLEKEDLLSAHQYLFSALLSNKFHVYAWYYEAVLHLKNGCFDEALANLSILSTDPRKVWGEADFLGRVAALKELVMQQKQAQEALEVLQWRVQSKRQSLTEEENHLL